MVHSLDSTRPIMAPSLASNRVSKRFSVFSIIAPSVAASEGTIATQGDARLQAIKDWSQGLERLNSQRLQQQRYAPSAAKRDFISKVALGAKLDRALGRRLSGQDAVLRPRATELAEKQIVATE